MSSPLHGVCLFAFHFPAFFSVDSPHGGAAVVGLAVAVGSAHSSPALAHAVHSALTERPAVQCPAASALTPENICSRDITHRAGAQWNIKAVQLMVLKFTQHQGMFLEPLPWDVLWPGNAKSHLTAI